MVCLSNCLDIDFEDNVSCFCCGGGRVIFEASFVDVDVVIVAPGSFVVTTSSATVCCRR